MKALGRRPELVALISVFIGATIVVGKLVVGLLTGSLGIISEAVHSLLDLAASGFTLVAVRTARKPADIEHPYGHGRAENLAAFALLIVTLLIELGRAAVLRRVGRDAGSDALQADATNRWSDVLATVGVLAGLIGVRMGLAWADSVAALLVAVIIARAAGLLAWRSGDILIDRAPPGAERKLRAAIQGVSGVREVRSVRVRHSGPKLLGDAVIATARMLSLEAAGRLVDEVKRVAGAVLPELELTVLVEGQSRPSDLVERVHAAAARNGGVRDLHNVTVERESDGSLHLTMHAKLPGDMSLASASLASAGLEKALRAELPDATRIDIHLEPMEPHVVSGEDVTQRRALLAARMRQIIESHPAVKRGVDVELSDRHNRIHAHVVAELAGDVSLEQAHQVETELEEQIRRALPESAPPARRSRFAAHCPKSARSLPGRRRI